MFLGTGKSATIEACSMHAEKVLREAGHKPHHPRVLLLAHTGKAASLIGKLLHLNVTLRSSVKTLLNVHTLQKSSFHKKYSTCSTKRDKCSL